MLAFLAQDAETRVFCYANADLRKDQRDHEVLHFVEFWKQRTGRLPEELIFDSKLTTYAKLSELNRLGIQFITLRRRSKKLLQEIAQAPASAWRRVELESVGVRYRTPGVLDHRIKLNGYDGPLRQLTIADLGHEDPTLLLTNQLTRSPCHLIGRYAQRMLIENNIEDGIDFFHMDALSSAVAMKINCDLQLTLMASSLYRLLAVRVGNGYEIAKSRHLFRDLINASAGIRITDEAIVVKFQVPPALQWVKIPILRTIREHGYEDHPQRKREFLALLQFRGLGGGTRGPSSRPPNPPPPSLSSVPAAECRESRHFRLLVASNERPAMRDIAFFSRLLALQQPLEGRTRRSRPRGAPDRSLARPSTQRHLHLSGMWHPVPAP